MNRTLEWVSKHSIEEPTYEILSNELENSIPDWLARIKICSTEDEIENEYLENKLG